MKRELLYRDAREFVENRDNKPVDLKTWPYEDGEPVDAEHPDIGSGKFYGEDAAEWLEQINAEIDPSANQFVGTLLNPHAVELAGNVELEMNNRHEGNLHYGLEFDVQNDDEDTYRVIMRGIEENYSDRGLRSEFQSYEGNPALQEMLKEEFMDELM